MKHLIPAFILTIMTILTTAASSPVTVTLDGGATLHVFRPDRPNGSAVMMCPGGGYAMVAIDHEGLDMAGWFNERGITYAVLHYRLPKEPCDTLPIADGHAAMAYLSDNAATLGIDPARIGIMGASAGGHLAAHVAVTDPRVAFQALLYPVISLTEELCHRGTRNNLLGLNPSDETVALFSNENLVNASTPPAYIVVSQDDKTVKPRNSTLYFERLTEAGVPAELHIFPTGGHGWGYDNRFAHKAEWLATFEAWLRQFGV